MEWIHTAEGEAQERESSRHDDESSGFRKKCGREFPDQLRDSLVCQEVFSSMELLIYLGIFVINIIQRDVPIKI